MQRGYWWLSIIVAVCCWGCGGGADGPKTVPVSGRVTLDGEPIASGDISFLASGSGDKTYAGKITNGQFQFESTPGKKKVTVSAMREVPGETSEDNPGEVTAVLEDIIPDVYKSSDTPLEADVTEGGENRFEFEVTTP